MRKICRVNCKKCKKIKKIIISCICYKTLLLSSICNECRSEDKKMFQEEESIKIFKILGLIGNYFKT